MQDLVAAGFLPVGRQVARVKNAGADLQGCLPAGRQTLSKAEVFGVSSVERLALQFIPYFHSTTEDAVTSSTPSFSNSGSII